MLAMRSSFSFGRFFRTRVRIHYSWILALPLITLAVTTQFSTESSLLSRVLYGAAASVSFFFTMLFRELMVILLTELKGAVIEGVIVFPFGGLHEVDPETTTPSHELLTAVTGMLANLAIASLFYITYLLPGKPNYFIIDIVLKWLAFFFLTLGLFHIVPGFPLEGGRILHAILWKSLNNARRATVIASWISWTIGILMMVGGVLALVLTVERFTGAFLTALGLILQNAATHSRRQPKRVIQQ